MDNNNEEKVDQKVRLTGLWKNKSAAGNAYYSGTLGAARILGFPNFEKRDDKSPDLVLYLVPRVPKEEGSRADSLSDAQPRHGSQNFGSSNSGSQNSGPQETTPKNPVQAGFPDDVPF